MNTAHAHAIPRRDGLRKPQDDRRLQNLVWLLEHRAQILTSIAVAAIVGDGLMHLLGAGAAGQMVWRGAVALLAAELTFEVRRTLVVERSLGVTRSRSWRWVGSVALNPELAGAVSGLMFSGGASLEAIASRRARRELTALVQRGPTVAQLRVDDRLQGIPVEQVRLGERRARTHRHGSPGRRDRDNPEAAVDISTLIGESLPETIKARHAGVKRFGQRRRSGLARGEC